MILNNRKDLNINLIVQKGCCLYSGHQEEDDFTQAMTFSCNIIFHSLTEPWAEMRICRINDRQVDGEAEKHIIGMFLWGKKPF